MDIVFEVVGWVGTVLLITAYFLLSIGRIPNGRTYQLFNLLGSIGHSSAGRHDTRDLSTGIEASGAPMHKSPAAELTAPAASPPRPTHKAAANRAHSVSAQLRCCRRDSFSLSE